MEISARNNLKGRIKRVTMGTVMAEITVDIGDGKEIVASITKGSSEKLGLKVGDEVSAVIKSTDVMIAK